jgi:hypothetical protein
MNSDHPIEEPSRSYTSRLPFDGQVCRAAAVFCSDGRFTHQVNDFLQHGLGLRGYDRLAIAGGPACFAGHAAAHRQEEAAVFHLQFLARLHQLERLILISHQDCGFYRNFLGIAPSELLPRKRADLGIAAQRVRQATPQLKVEGYLARLRNAEVWFEKVNV